MNVLDFLDKEVENKDISTFCIVGGKTDVDYIYRAIYAEITTGSACMTVRIKSVADLGMSNSSEIQRAIICEAINSHYEFIRWLQECFDLRKVNIFYRSAQSDDLALRTGIDVRVAYDSAVGEFVLTFDDSLRQLLCDTYSITERHVNREAASYNTFLFVTTSKFGQKIKRSLYVDMQSSDCKYKVSDLREWYHSVGHAGKPEFAYGVGGRIVGEVTDLWDSLDRVFAMDDVYFYYTYKDVVHCKTRDFCFPINPLDSNEVVKLVPGCVRKTFTELFCNRSRTGQTTAGITKAEVESFLDKELKQYRPQLQEHEIDVEFVKKVMQKHGSFKNEHNSHVCKNDLSNCAEALKALTRDLSNRGLHVVRASGGSKKGDFIEIAFATYVEVEDIKAYMSEFYPSIMNAVQPCFNPYYVKYNSLMIPDQERNKLGIEYDC